MLPSVVRDEWSASSGLPAALSTVRHRPPERFVCGSSHTREGSCMNTPNTDTDSQPVGIDPQNDLYVDCYVRSDVSPASDRQIEAVVDRIRTLQEDGLVTDYDVRQWPPKQRTTVDAGTSGRTRTEIISEFERWADQHDCSLEPAFRRRPVPSSVLGTEDDRETVRVPLIALALYQDDRETAPPQGVVPYTDDGETRTVCDWLEAVEDVPSTVYGTPQSGRGTDSRGHL